MFTSLFLYNVNIIAFILFVEIHKNISVAKDFLIMLTLYKNKEVNMFFQLFIFFFVKFLNPFPTTPLKYARVQIEFHNFQRNVAIVAALLITLCSKTTLLGWTGMQTPQI
jgi:hypothetical protein